MRFCSLENLNEHPVKHILCKPYLEGVHDLLRCSAWQRCCLRYTAVGRSVLLLAFGSALAWTFCQRGSVLGYDKSEGLLWELLQLCSLRVREPV